MSEPRYPYLLVDTTPDNADEVSSLLFELGALGVEERDAGTLITSRDLLKVTLVANFETEQAAMEAKSNVDPSLDPAVDFVIGDAWRDAWKEHFRPFTISEGIVIKPPWESYAAKPGERVLELEPGRAFGTGLHETTSLVAAALSRMKERVRDQEILDVGCGSGILSIIALALGARHATALDIDSDSMETTRENAERNQMSAMISASTDDVSTLTRDYPVVLANIEARVLVPMAPYLTARVASKGWLVLSGILAPQEQEIIAAYPSFDVVEVPKKGEWISIVLRKTA